MPKRYIMTAFGQDRVGIVADITQVMYDNGCNLEDSSMTRLADEFALILLFSSTDPELEGKLDLACRRLEREKGLSTFFRSLEKESPESLESSPTHRLHIEGIDQCGIVYKVSRYMTQNNINIVTLRSKRSFSPQSGTAIYTIDIEVEVPDSLTDDSLRKGLRKVGDELHVDIKVS